METRRSVGPVAAAAAVMGPMTVDCHGQSTIGSPDRLSVAPTEHRLTALDPDCYPAGIGYHTECCFSILLGL